MRKLTVFSILGVLLLVAVGAQADVTVTNGSSAGWVFISHNTYGLPADLSGIGCGIENETTCEPMGVFNFNVSFNSSGAVNIMDATGAISDQIQWGNGGNGLGVVTFKSDPDLNNLVGDVSSICIEGDADHGGVAGGCVGSFIISTAGGDVTVYGASDGEVVFDPFGLGADSSDEIKFVGATPTEAPEPGSMALLGAGLLGLAGTIRRKLNK